MPETTERQYHKVLFLISTALISSFFIFVESSTSSLYPLLLCILLLVIKMLYKGARICYPRNEFFLHLLMFSGFCFLSGLWAYDSSAAVSNGITLSAIFFCTWIVFDVFADEGENGIGILFSAIKWSGIIVAFYSIEKVGIAGMIDCIVNGSRFISNLGTNGVSIFMAISLLAAIHQIQQNGFRISDILLGVSIIVMLATDSRTAVLELVIGVLILVYFNSIVKGRFRSLFILAMGIAFLAALGMNTNMLAGLFDRLNEALGLFSQNRVADESSQIRMNLIIAGLQQFKKAPLFGIGMANGYFVSRLVTGHSYYLHCNYVELLVGGGILGFFLYYSMFFCAIKNNLLTVERGKHSAAIVALMVMILAGDVGTVTYFSKDTYIYLLMAFMNYQCIRNSFEMG